MTKKVTYLATNNNNNNAKTARMLLLFSNHQNHRIYLFCLRFDGVFFSFE